jgi:hypothetical protein
MCRLDAASCAGGRWVGGPFAPLVFVDGLGCAPSQCILTSRIVRPVNCDEICA